MPKGTENQKTKKVRVTAYKFDQVDSLVVGVRKDGQSLKTKIHSVAVCIAKHWHDNPKQGAVCAEKMTALVDAAGYHAKALSKWVQTMTPMQFSDENNMFFVHKDAKIMGKVFIEARDTPFWDVSPPPAPKAINDMNELRKLRDRMLKRTEDGKGHDDDVIHMDVWRSVTDLLTQAEASTEAA